VNTNDSFRTDITADAVLLILDAEEGEGIDVARQHHIGSFPTFLLENADGQLLDRWLGYGNVESFMADLTAATEDPMTLDARMEQFASEPTAKDAIKVADIRRMSGLVGEAMAWYDRAQELDPDADLAGSIFQARATGHRMGLYDLASVKTAADPIIESGSPRDVGRAVSTLDRATRDSDQRGVYHDALRRAATRLEGMDEDGAERVHASLMIDVKLERENDPQAAFEWKKRSMGEGWQENAGALNNVAWWAFEHEVALDEAEEYARKGVGLAEPGNPRGNVLDTLAEICNLKGDCGEAVELMREALREDPDSEYFQKQLARFEELLAKQQQDG